MKDFIRVACVSPKILIGDCEANAEQIMMLIDEVTESNAQFVVFPELCITGATCGDLFKQKSLIKKAKESLVKISSLTKGKEIVAIIGLPLRFKGELYNVAAVVYDGEVLGFVPKSYLESKGANNETRYFKPGLGVDGEVDVAGIKVPFDAELMFDCVHIPNFKFGVEVGTDLWVPNPPSGNLSLAGATVIANPSATNEVIGTLDYKRDSVRLQSKRCVCAYLFADAGERESTTDYVFGSSNVIAECGKNLATAVPFSNETIYADIDLDKIESERINALNFEGEDVEMESVEVGLTYRPFELSRDVDPNPFIDSDEKLLDVLNMQTMGLKQRLWHTNSKSCVVGISGGLDSTLALIVIVLAFDKLGLDRKNIYAVTMPGFGTSKRTNENAMKMMKELGVTIKEIDITDSVKTHFDQIGHDINDKDTTYENAQARARTYILMDLANEVGGLMVGTGDLSELALGWTTYNGDHMSMYAVNSNIPKTVIRKVVSYVADNTKELFGNESDNLSDVLIDVVDTPVSPELLPDKDGEITQKTEDLVGPYELHDFFIYYVLKYGYKPQKILYLAGIAFKDKYDLETIKKWLKVFYKRFFSQQFKRNCMPDGTKIFEVGLSPRGDFVMPSDANVREWLEDLD